MSDSTLSTWLALISLFSLFQWLLSANHCAASMTGLSRWTLEIHWNSLLTCRLYFTTFPHPPPRQETLNNPSSQLEQVNVRGICTPPCESLEPAKHYYFTIDDQLMYMSFFQDWGPLNVAMVYKACIFIHSLLIVSDSLFHEVRLQAFHDRCTKEWGTEQTIAHTLHPKPTPISRCPRMLGES